ncbi:MAG: pilus assembly protein [Chloroflexi bacterium]|nr:pilus assembly protein [Chloroflexota bacterium]
MSHPNPIQPSMDTPRRRGQALAEFALTLPILLLLVFGIIEFARLFQTWIVLQSAARAGARAASIGAINYEIFDVTPDAQPIDLRVLDAVVACSDGDLRGTKATDVVTGVEYYDGTEGFFATVYDGTDCDPTSEDHLQLRKDILRVFTVIAAVRDASRTIAVYESRVDQAYDSITPAQAFDFFKGYWTRPYKSAENSTSPGWISVEVCSTRPLLDGTAASDVDARFATIRNSGDAAAAGGNTFDYPEPFCMLNEIPAEGPSGPRLDALENAGHRWFDVGGPGDRVSVFIKFNHPLITPLNLAQYVSLQSRRSSVNESFRAPKAVGAFQRSIPPGQPDPEDILPTWTPSPSLSPTNTSTATATFTRTPTNTPPTFSCDNIQVIWSDNPFIGSQMFMTVQNTNVEPTELSRVRLAWNSKPGFPLMYAQAFSLDANVHWQGTAPASPPQTLVDTRTDGEFYDGNPSNEPSSFRFVTTSAVWSALFVNGPSSLMTSFTLFDFSAEFEFSNPAGAPCIILLTAPPVPETTPTTVPTVGPSPSPTPSCDALSNIQLQNQVIFDSFDGSARMNLVNTGTLPVYLLGFQLVWPDPTHPDIGRTAGTYFLRRVTVGGNNTTDPLSIEVWTSSAAGQDATGNTRSTLPFDVATSSASAEGTWNINAVLLPGNNYVFLDFDGFAGRLTQFGVIQAHFASSRFFIGWAAGCTDGTGGPGTQPTGALQVTLPSPTTTNTRRPTDPPQPTLTASNTIPSNTPSRTNTFLPTVTRTNTPPSTNTPSRTPIGFTPTQGGGGES